MLLITDQVFTRYGLQKLFGPDCLALTSDQSLLYPDLPSNMVCAILVVLKSQHYIESRNSCRERESTGDLICIY